MAIKVPQSFANISTGCVSYQANYYDVLNIPKSSTHGEIKSAYYRLSMMYHPDKNQGSESAAIKFREINQAYEVLGNFRLRRLYDRGVYVTVQSQTNITCILINCCRHNTHGNRIQIRP